MLTCREWQVKQRDKVLAKLQYRESKSLVGKTLPKPSALKRAKTVNWGSDAQLSLMNHKVATDDSRKIWKLKFGKSKRKKSKNGEKRSVLDSDCWEFSESGEHEGEDTVDGGKYALVGYSVHSSFNPGKKVNVLSAQQKEEKEIEAKKNFLVAAEQPSRTQSKRNKPQELADALPNKVGTESKPPKPWCVRVCGCTRVRVRSHSTQTPFYL